MTIAHVVNLDYKNSNGIKSVLIGLAPAQERLEHIVYVCNMFENKKKIFKNDLYIGSYLSFKTIINEILPDLIVFHGGYEMRYYYYAHYLRTKKINYIIVPHGGTSKFNLQKNRLLKTTVNILFTSYFVKKSSGIIFLNENERQNSIFYHNMNSYGIIPNGVNLQIIDIKEKTNDSKVHFIFLSRIDIKYKGLDILLKAIEILSIKYPDMDFDFNFYGGRYDPSIVEEFKKMISETKGPIYYHGEIYGTDKDNAYRHANIYVLPSLSEGMPLTVLEALSFGCPCIVTPQTNMAALIQKNNAGWVTTADVDSLVVTLRKAYTDYINNRTTYITNSVNAVKPYSWDAIANKSIQEYTKLINSYR